MTKRRNPKVDKEARVQLLRGMLTGDAGMMTRVLDPMTRTERTKGLAYIKKMMRVPNSDWYGLIYEIGSFSSINRKR